MLTTMQRNAAAQTRASSSRPLYNPVRTNGRCIAPSLVASRARAQLSTTVAAAAAEPNQEGSQEDAFVAATSRLQRLLEEAEWDSAASVRAEIASYDPDLRLSFLINMGMTATLIGVGLNWMTGEDALGGLTFAPHTLQAVQLGAVAALPLAAASLLSRTQHVRRAVPLLEELQIAQQELLQPMIQGFTAPQLLLAVSTTLLPALLLLLPSVHGILCLVADLALDRDWEVATAATAASSATEVAAAAVPPLLMPLGAPDVGTALGEAAVQALGPDGPWYALLLKHEAGTLMPAVVSGFLAAYVVMAQLAPRRSQVEAIKDALAASHRYFRLTLSMERGTTAATSSEQLTAQQLAATGHSSSNIISTSSSRMLGQQQGGLPSHSASTAQSSLDAMLMHTSAAPMALPAAAAPSSSSTNSAECIDSQSAATSDAFTKVSVLWLLTRRKVCQLCYMLTACQVVFYGLLWQEAGGDLAAPATAAISSVMLELWLCQREADAQAARQQERRKAKQQQQQ